MLRHSNQDSLHLGSGTCLFCWSPLVRRCLSRNILPALHANLVWQRLPTQLRFCVCLQGSVLVAVLYRKIWHTNKIKQCRMQSDLHNTAPTNDALPLTSTAKGPFVVPVAWASHPSPLTLLAEPRSWLHATTVLLLRAPKPSLTRTGYGCRHHPGVAENIFFSSKQQM